MLWTPQNNTAIWEAANSSNQKLLQYTGGHLYWLMLAVPSNSQQLYWAEIDSKRTCKQQKEQLWFQEEVLYFMELYKHCSFPNEGFWISHLSECKVRNTWQRYQPQVQESSLYQAVSISDPDLFDRSATHTKGGIQILYYCPSEKKGVPSLSQQLRKRHPVVKQVWEEVWWNLLWRSLSPSRDNCRSLDSWNAKLLDCSWCMKCI